MRSQAARPETSRSGKVRQLGPEYQDSLTSDLASTSASAWQLRAKFAALLLVVLAFRAGGGEDAPTSRRPSKFAAEWRFDLRQLGYPKRMSEYAKKNFHTPPVTIAFSDKEDLVTTFIDPDDGLGSLPAAQRDRNHLRLYGATFDATTGEVKSKTSWISSNPNDGVVAAREGTLVVRTHEKLALYSPAWEQTKEIDLGVVRGIGMGLCGTTASPTGRAMLLELCGGRDRDYLWLNTRTLERTAAHQGLILNGTVSDTDMAWEGTPAPRACEVRLKKPGGMEITIFKSDYCHITPTFINDHLIAVIQGHVLVLLRPDGEVRHCIEFRHKSYLSRVTPSADGRRFAFTVSVIRNVWEIFGPQSEIPKRLVIYDLAAGRIAREIAVKGYKKGEDFDIALSPDGTLVATLTAGMLQVFRLPETP